jgi:hypothetical protein
VALTRQWPDRRLSANDTLSFKFVTAHDRLDPPPRVTFHVQTSSQSAAQTNVIAPSAAAARAGRPN